MNFLTEINAVLPVINYGDVLHRKASAQNVSRLDNVYRGALRFIAQSNLHLNVIWLSVSAQRLAHWCVFIYKTIICTLPSYLKRLITRKLYQKYELKWARKVLGFHCLE